jgi:hypothetical protein
MIIPAVTRLFLTLTAVAYLLVSTAGAADFTALHRLTGGGVTPEVNPTEQELEALVPLHTYRLRLINIDDNLTGITRSGDVIVNWSPHLVWGLEQCKKHAWIPHIIIGQWVPGPLATLGRGGRKYGPTSWISYEKYLIRVFRFVTIENHFPQTEWEVGNEMDLSTANWVAPQAYRTAAGQEGLGPYVELFRHVSHAMALFQKSNPQLTMRLGGPAATVNALRRYRDFNWMDGFLSALARDHLKCDFLSIHIYGNEISGARLRTSLQALMKHAVALGVRTPLCISEWGPTDTTYPPLTDTPSAGSFAAEFLTTLEASGINDAIFMAQRGGAGSSTLFRMNNQPTDSYRGMLLLARLGGSRIPCRTSYSDLKCLAAHTDPKSFDVVLWRLDWSAASLAPSQTGEHASQEYLAGDLAAGIAPGTAASATRVEIDGKNAAGPSAAISSRVEKNGELAIKSRIPLRYGDYAEVRLRTY